MMRGKTIYPMAEGVTTADTYAVWGDANKFQKHKHAWKVWRVLKEFGCVVYPVAGGIQRIDGSKVYPNLEPLKDKVTVVIPCLLPEKLTCLVADASAAGIQTIWFQQQTWSGKLEQECESAGIKAIRGCVLRHKDYPPFSLRYFNPCYWHGLRDAKVPLKRYGR